MVKFRRPLLALLAVCVLAPAPAAGSGFPPITAEERTLASVPGHPAAPAVVLFKKAEFWLMDLARQEASSRLVVSTRVKILSEQGKSRGEVEIPHSGEVRLSKLEGRTVLPDGRVLPLPAEARFVRRLSRAERRFVTSVAFPAVEVGAILDYRFELRFNDFMLLEPWHLSEEVPVRWAEIVYHVPGELSARTWSRDPLEAGVKTESERVGGGATRVRVWAENLPAVPDEPFALPFSDLATQSLLLPTTYADALLTLPLLESWASASRLTFEHHYERAWRKDGAAVRRARELAGQGSAREKAAALYRFVRDEIANEPLEGVGVRAGVTIDGVLARRSGDSAEKALLLQRMLRAVGVAARPVWAASRSRGQIDPEVANPAWFQHVLVAAEVDGGRVYLDPSDPGLGFGRLRPDHEGTTAVLPDPKKPETVTLPVTPFDQNRRRVALALALGADGALGGTGTLLLSGHHAWQRIGWLETREREREAWREWLEESFEGFTISDLAIEESPKEQTVRLSWVMAQRAEEALGDEASLAPSAPLGPARQPFALPVAARRTPVLFSFPDRDEVELELRWPAGWALETQPQPARHDAPGIGAFEVSVSVDATGRSLTYRRQVDLREQQLETAVQYTAVQALFRVLERSDAQGLVLVRR